MGIEKATISGFSKLVQRIVAMKEEAFRFLVVLPTLNRGAKPDFIFGLLMLSACTSE